MISTSSVKKCYLTKRDLHLSLRNINLNDQRMLCCSIIFCNLMILFSVCAFASRVLSDAKTDKLWCEWMRWRQGLTRFGIFWLSLGEKGYLKTWSFWFLRCTLCLLFYFTFMVQKACFWIHTRVSNEYHVFQNYKTLF